MNIKISRYMAYKANKANICKKFIHIFWTLRKSLLQGFLKRLFKNIFRIFLLLKKKLFTLYSQV